MKLEYKSKLVLLAKELYARIDRWDLSEIIEQDKADGSIVTNYDLELNIIINDFLNKEFPGTNIVGEEVSRPELNSDYTWYIDPLDGTADFVKLNGQWVVQIGLCYRGTPILGFVLHHEEAELFYAEKDQGCVRISLNSGNEEKVLLNPQELLDESIYIHSNSRPSKVEDQFSKSLSDTSISMGSFGLKVIQIVKSQAHLYINFRKLIGLWDLCAPQVILEEAGGYVFIENDELVDYSQKSGFRVGKRLACCHPAIALSVRDKMRESFEDESRQ